MADNSLKKFITLDDEIALRIQYKNVLKHEGLAGLLQCLGEINAAMLVGLDLWQEYVAGHRKPL